MRRGSLGLAGFLFQVYSIVSLIILVHDTKLTKEYNNIVQYFFVYNSTRQKLFFFRKRLNTFCQHLFSSLFVLDNFDKNDFFKIRFLRGNVCKYLIVNKT